MGDCLVAGNTVCPCTSPGPSPHCLLPQCCCGYCHQPVYAPSGGSDQERGQEVREELLPEKGAGVKSGPLLSWNALGRPGDWAPDSPPALRHCGDVCVTSLFLISPQVMGNRRSDEPPKTKKGLSSILDPARWNRGEPAGKRASLSLAHPVGPRPPKLTGSLFCFSPRFPTSEGRG